MSIGRLVDGGLHFVYGLVLTALFTGVAALLVPWHPGLVLASSVSAAVLLLDREAAQEAIKRQTGFLRSFAFWTWTVGKNIETWLGIVPTVGTATLVSLWL